MVGCGNSKFWRGSWVHIEPDELYPEYRESYFTDLRETGTGKRDNWSWNRACGSLWDDGEWQLFCEDCLKKLGYIW